MYTGQKKSNLQNENLIMNSTRSAGGINECRQANQSYFQILFVHGVFVMFFLLVFVFGSLLEIGIGSGLLMIIHNNSRM